MSARLPHGPRTGREWSRVQGERPVEGSDGHYHRSFMVERKDDPSETARFKCLRDGRPRAAPYSLGVEWVAYALGTVIGVPVAPIYLEHYGARPGALSPWIHNSLSWWMFSQARLPQRDIVNVDSVPLSVVFDVWLANTDRWEKNLLIQSEPASKSLLEADAYRLWLIDHGDTLLWPPGKFGLSEGDDLATAELRPDGSTHAERQIRDRMKGGAATRSYWAAFENLGADERGALYERIKSVEDATIGKAL